MRKSLLIFLLIGGIVLGIGLFNNLVQSGEVKTAPGQPGISNITEAFKPAATPQIISDPVSFSIPSLGIENTSVESVGLDKENKMDTPKNADNVAWYNLGAKPGERGNAVMAGHLDKKDGSPAVFYKIKDLKPGAELSVKARDGSEYKYKVTEVKSYELAKFPLEEVFGVGDKARLNLITCEGTWNADAKLYSHRLVVYSELKS